MRSKYRLAAVLLSSCLWLCACGYHFSGTGDFPAGIQTVAVHMFENRSAETGAETIFTNDFVYELTRSGKVQVIDTQLAQAVLYGTIQSLTTSNITYRNVNVSNERRVTAVVNLRLVKSGGQVVRTMRGIQDYEEFKVINGDKAATEQNRREALRLLSRRLAEKMYNRITEDF